MTEYYICAILILAPVCAVLIKRIIGYRRKQSIYNYVSWIEFGGIESQRWGSLLEYIWDAQERMKIPTQYCVLSSDEENAHIILRKFQQDIAERYFAGKLSLVKSNTKIREEDMFFYLLFVFLREHECDYSFEENIMHKQISKKSYGSWGGELYDSENELSDFGISFEKLHYVASEYCYRHEEIRKAFEIRRCDYLMKQIDEKHISISRM